MDINRPKFKNKSTFRVAPNIALIKYWGKFEEDSILPLNSSISITLSTDDLYTETSVSMSDKYTSDTLILNGVLQASLSPRLVRIFEFFRIKCKLPANFFFKIKSKNSFPTAAGLASSSSGYAAIVLCLADLLNFLEEYPGQLTEMARLGSGSACRSLFGGVVEWKGVPIVYLNQENREFISLKVDLILDENERKELARYCIASQIFPPEIFNDYLVMILIAHEKEKEISSTEGMKISVKSSELLWHRVLNLVPPRIKKMKDAIKEKDMNKVVKLMIKDSNQFHAICLDTYPPLLYLTDFSRSIINLVLKVNKLFTKKVGYTFDAGPHAVLLIHKSVYQDFFKLVLNISQLSKEW